MLELKGRTISKEVEPEIGLSILKHTDKHKVDWGFSCTRGVCARCRCHVSEGAEHLNEPTGAEILRLELEEIEEGFRLGCQAVVASEGPIKVKLQTYF